MKSSSSIWLDIEQSNRIFTKDTNIFRQIKVIRYNSVIFSMQICEKTVFLLKWKIFIVFHNSLHSKPCFICDDSKYCLHSLLYNLLQSLTSVWVLVLRYFVTGWDLDITALLKVFDMYGAWLAWHYFLIGHWLVQCQRHLYIVVIL